ncbi:unnamed protein product [Diatraea saccharalis]|uniref:Uncharacterized protein n=1 Tax=Diatraea saccharalis TaxID=40085 RepID=A0A9N9R244_9NEOP|nr:unnamed protein product [Diatraea saccharalis]
MEPELLPDYLDLNGSFDEQIRNIMQNVRLTRQEVDNLNLLYVHLEGALQTSWPGCKVLPFGSIITGLGIKTSDVDCFIEIPGDNYNKNNRNNHVIIARNLLRRQPWLFQNLFAITSAKVPILKFFHIPTQRHCDINFKSKAGVRNSSLMAYLLHMDKRAVTLAVIIKYWSKVHNLTGTNMMTSYGLTILVIFYLQQINILPSVCKLQKDNEMYAIDGWNTAFREDFSFMSDNCQSVYELLGGFFKFYSAINFEENIISPFTGNLIPRNLFKNLDDVPSVFDMYKINIGSKEYEALRIDTKMCIQDPFEHNRNCTMSVYPRLANTIISHFLLAAQIYDENTKDFYVIDLLARTPPPIHPIKNKHKVGHNNHNKPKSQKKTIAPINNSKVTKPNKRSKKITNNFEVLYRNMKMQRQRKV